MLKQAEFSRGKGCPYCGRTGYRGRIGIYELMLINNRMREHMFRGADTKEIRQAAINNGMSTLYADSMLKVIRGLPPLKRSIGSRKRPSRKKSLWILGSDLDSL